MVDRTDIKAKPYFRRVDTSNMPIGTTGILIQINVSEFL